MSDHPSRLGPIDYLVAAAINTLWGLNIVAMKLTVDEAGAFMAGAIRLGAVMLICLPWMRHTKGQMRGLLLLGMINGGLFPVFMNLALKVSTNVGALAIVGQLSVPIAVILGVLLLGERMTFRRIGGITLAFVGVALLVFDRRIANELPGLILMIGAATCWATSSLLQRRLAGVPVLAMYAWTGLIGFTVMLPLSLLIEPQAMERAMNLRWETIGWFAFSIFGATLMGQGGLAWLLGRHPLSLIMPMTLCATVVSVIASHVFFGTPVTPIMIMGGLITLVGVMIVTLAAPRQSSRVEV